MRRHLLAVTSIHFVETAGVFELGDQAAVDETFRIGAGNFRTCVRERLNETAAPAGLHRMNSWRYPFTPVSRVEFETGALGEKTT